MSPDIALWPALAGAGLGAILDLKDRRLPNWLCALVAISGAVGIGISAGPAIVPWTLTHAALALAVGMVLFRLGWIGGGDAKFYAAAACAVPLNQGLYLLGWTSACGLALLLVMTIVRLARRPGGGLTSLRGWSVPYGVAIFAGFGLLLFLA
jgi:prepilin peptidase CpaA